MGRKKRIIDLEIFESCCEVACTKADICHILSIADKTLDRIIKEHYFDEDGKPLKFIEVYNKCSANARNSLRRAQYKFALKGNKTLLIWLGKNWLGQTDKTDETDNDINLNDFAKLVANSTTARPSAQTGINTDNNKTLDQFDEPTTHHPTLHRQVPNKQKKENNEHTN